MKTEDFNKYLDYLIETHVKGKMCSKSAEYARGDDKLYNFKRAGEIDQIPPEQALRGMDLKHRTSINDMLNDNKECSKELWEEKITDHVNYMFLLLGLLYEKYGWRIK